MIYVYEYELDDYISQGYDISQLSVIPDYEPIPDYKTIPDNHSQFDEIRSIIKSVLRESVEFDNNKTFIPLPNVAQRAQEALNAVSRNDLTQSGTNQGSGKSKAKELASKQTQSFDMMRRIKSFFETNQEAYNAEKSSWQRY